MFFQMQTIYDSQSNQSYNFVSLVCHLHFNEWMIQFVIWYLWNAKPSNWIFLWIELDEIDKADGPPRLRGECSAWLFCEKTLWWLPERCEWSACDHDERLKVFQRIIHLTFSISKRLMTATILSKSSKKTNANDIKRNESHLMWLTFSQMETLLNWYLTVSESFEGKCINLHSDGAVNSPNERRGAKATRKITRSAIKTRKGKRKMEAKRASHSGPKISMANELVRKMTKRHWVPTS